MRRHIFHFVYLIGIAIGILFLGSCTNDKQSLSSEKKAQEEFKDIEPKAEIASKEISKLYTAITNDLETRSTNSSVSDDFGGLYLDDKQEIHIVLKGNYEYFKGIVEKNVKSVQYHIDKGEFSLKELNELQNKLATINIPKYVENNISSIWVDIKNNRIVVELLNISEDKISDFKKEVSDSPMIVFKYSSERITDTANLNAGSGIIPALTPGCSIGYRAWNSAGKLGFVSSGHAFTKFEQAAYIKANNVKKKVGVCKQTQLKDKLDAAFILITDDNYVPTAIVNGTSQSLTSVAGVADIQVGKYVSLKGINSDFKGVKILANNAIAFGTNGVKVYDLIKVGPAATKGGDSGGIAYSGNVIHGIIKGVSSGNTYVVKASNINSTFGLRITK